MLITHDDMLYSEFISTLARLREVKTYCEIGVNNAENLKYIACDIAIGVDPNFVISQPFCAGKKEVHLFQSTSDAFFRTGKTKAIAPEGVDLFFLDGMHLFEYLLRDFSYAERNSHRNSLIVLHDCLPMNREMAERSFTPATAPENRQYRDYWTGDVWKVVRILQDRRKDLRITAVKCPPTGLIVVSGLDPESTALDDDYQDIVDRYRTVDGGPDAISAYLASLNYLNTREVDLSRDHSLFFRL
jgi:hypothetical protein